MTSRLTNKIYAYNKPSNPDDEQNLQKILFPKMPRRQ